MSPTVEYLIVAGGGGASIGYSNVAGDRGNVKTGHLTGIVAGCEYIVTVGAGGIGSIHGIAGGNGSNSSFSNITAIGGSGGSSIRLSDRDNEPSSSNLENSFTESPLTYGLGGVATTDPNNGTIGGSGGSGMVSIKFVDTMPNAYCTKGSPTYTKIPGYKIYTWTNSGSITW